MVYIIILSLYQNKKMDYKDNIFISNSGLGHSEYVILLKLYSYNKEYLVIDKRTNDDMYKVGEITTMDDYEVKSYRCNIEDTELYKNSPFLCDYFVKNYYK